MAYIKPLVNNYFDLVQRGVVDLRGCHMISLNFETWTAIKYCLGLLEILKISISSIIGYYNSKPIERDALFPNVQVTDIQTLKKTKTVLSHVQDGVLVSKVCENLGIHSNQYYEWQKQAFSSLSHVFSRDTILLDRSHQL